MGASVVGTSVVGAWVVGAWVVGPTVVVDASVVVVASVVGADVVEAFGDIVVPAPEVLVEHATSARPPAAKTAREILMIAAAS